MTDLAGRGPIGLKQPKPENRQRKAMRKVSKKRQAYLASDDRKDAVQHMGRVAQLPCLVCGAWPVEVHHMPDPRSDLRVIPLCAKHHRREYGDGSFHYSPRAFYAAHGCQTKLLIRVAVMLQK